MTLNEYIATLQQFAKDNPTAGEMEVVTSSDDEGNSFNKIHYAPSLGQFEDREFLSVGDDEDGEVTPNAVCVN